MSQLKTDLPAAIDQSSPPAAGSVILLFRRIALTIL